MATSEVGLTLFPIVLAELDNNLINRTVTQTMLTSEVALLTFNLLAADRVFYFGAFNPGPDGSYGQEATHNYIFDTVANAMFEDAADNLAGYNQSLDIIQYIGLSGERIFGDAANGLFSSLAENSLVRRAYQRDADDAFAWNNHDDKTSTDFIGYAVRRSYNTSDAMLSDSVTGASVQEVFQFFDALDSTLDASATEYDRGPTQSVIQDHVDFKITDGPTCPEKEFSPFVGASGDTSYGNVDTSNPALGTGTLELNYPAVSPTLTLTLKNPEFNDQGNFSFARIDRATRGGERKIFAANKWGETQKLQLTVSNLETCKVTVDQIVTFLNTSLGKEIKLTDWHNREWTGVIIVPETDIVQNVSGFQFVLTFQGELV